MAAIQASWRGNRGKVKGNQCIVSIIVILIVCFNWWYNIIPYCFFSWAHNHEQQRAHNNNNNTTLEKNGVILINFLAYFEFSFAIFIEHCLTLFSIVFIFFRRITLEMNKNSKHDKESIYMLYKQLFSSYTSYIEVVFSSHTSRQV